MGPSSTLRQADLAELAAGLAVRVSIDNGAVPVAEAARAGAVDGRGFLLRIELTNTAGIELPAAGWQLHIPSVRRLLAVMGDGWELAHITGDQHVLRPAGFPGLAPGESAIVELLGESFVLQWREILPRWYLTAPGCEPEVVRATDTDDVAGFVTEPGFWRVGESDETEEPGPAARYRRNAELLDVPPAPLIPTPASYRRLPGRLDLRAGVALRVPPGVSDRTAAFWRERAAILGLDLSGGIPLRIDMRDDVPPESYTLVVGPEEISITGDGAGVGWAMMSLFGLLPAPGSAPIVDCCEITDRPRYRYRSIMIDIARNFRGPAYLRRLLDQMAAYKLNVLHLHLTDDEGWRLEIAGLPELTEVGGRRGHTESELDQLLTQLGSGPRTQGGHLTRTQYIELVAEAAARGITIVPEINMPGHSRAAVVAMEARYERTGDDSHRLVDPQDDSRLLTVQNYDRRAALNPALDSSLRFVETVMADVVAMHREAGHPLRIWHSGGDEVHNILLGPGFTDRADPRPGLGAVDIAGQHEPWEASPAAQRKIAELGLAGTGELGAWFVRQVAGMAARLGATTLHTWQDGLQRVDSAADMPLPAVAEVWVPVSAGAAAVIADFQARGFGAVGCAPDFTYFDAPYEADPGEQGTTWAARALDERTAFSYPPDNPAQAAVHHTGRFGGTFSDAVPGDPRPLTGIQAQLWSESTRTDERADAMIFPRLLATAERAWHRADWEEDPIPGKVYGPAPAPALLRDYSAFAAALGGRELAKLDAAGVAYRVPPAGAVVGEAGQVRCNVALPGLGIEAQVNGDWVPAAGLTLGEGESLLLRVRSADGRRVSATSAIVHRPM